jgi:N-acyl-L-homoserine lactone synthetase
MSEIIPLPRGPRAPSTHDPRNNADAFEIRLLTRSADISEALRLRYKAYAEQGYVMPVEGAEYRHDDLSTTAIFGGYDSGRLVATMRLCFSLPGDGLSNLPCAPYYPALAEYKATASDGLVEVCRLGIDPAIGNTSYRATLYGFMVRSAFAAARAAGVSAIVVATKPDWVPYYKHLLSFEQMGEPAFYPPGDVPITLLAGHIDQASHRARMRNRFFRVSDDDIARMRRTLAPLLAPQAGAVASAGDR